MIEGRSQERDATSIKTPLPVHSKKSKKHFQITKMATPDSEKISGAGLKVIQETKVYHFDSSKSWFQAASKKVQRWMGISNMLSGWIIGLIRGNTDVDPARLLNGKHATLNVAGAEHVQMKSSTGYLVDAHYLDASTFITNLERLGVKRKRLQLRALPEADRIKLWGNKSAKLFETVLPNHAAEFSGFQFSKKSENADEVKKILTEMNVDESRWTLCQTKDDWYLVRLDDVMKMTLHKWGQYGLEVSDLSDDKREDERKDIEARGTVLLSQGLYGMYEGGLSEVLTFALDGMNVMAYNAPGRGMSEGPADQKNINASINASYNFLKRTKNIPDEKILAKGLCFGAAPTAWLGKKHPNINLMLDQNPANFRDLIPKAMRMIAEHVFPGDKKPEGFQEHVRSLLANFLRGNQIIDNIAAIIFKGYDIAADLSCNKGHKLLHIDIPYVDSEKESMHGGDLFVPEHHPSLMLDAIEETPGKEVYLTINPSATHGHAWWNDKNWSLDIKGPSCYNEVVAFLKEADLKRDFFEPWKYE